MRVQEHQTVRWDRFSDFELEVMLTQAKRAREHLSESQQETVDKCVREWRAALGQVSVYGPRVLAVQGTKVVLAAEKSKARKLSSRWRKHY